MNKLSSIAYKAAMINSCLAFHNNDNTLLLTFEYTGSKLLIRFKDDVIFCGSEISRAHDILYHMAIGLTATVNREAVSYFQRTHKNL